jgi:hypothetical protein
MTKIVKGIESNDADVLHFLASGKSFEQYERDRLFTFNIDTEEAEKLMIKRCNKENADVIKRKKHHGHFSRYLFEKEKFLQDIRSLKPASHVNWQSMAKKYQIQTKNGVFPLNGGQRICQTKWYKHQPFQQPCTTQWTRLSPTCKACQEKTDKQSSHTILQKLEAH